MFGTSGLFVVLKVSLIIAVTNALPPQKIVGGIPAYPGEFPYQASLRYKDRHYCGGAIITTRHVVSSAGCVLPLTPLDKVTVMTGSVNLYEGQSHAVKAIVAHPQWNPAVSGFLDDISLITLAKPMIFDFYQNKIMLPIERPVSGTEAIVSGWGSMSSQYNPVPKLTKAEITIMKYADCYKKLMGNATVWPQQVCTSGPVGVGICMGDQGGPLARDNYLVGIASWGYLCGRGFPDVYTNILSYVEWIIWHVDHS